AQGSGGDPDAPRQNRAPKASALASAFEQAIHGLQERSQNFILLRALILSIALIGLLTGCSSGSGKQRTSYNSHQPPRGAELQERVPIKLESYPWEFWAASRDLQGNPMTNRALLEGDQYFTAGKRDLALKSYQTAQVEKLSPSEKEALTLRLAGLELGFDRADKALDLLSTYFRAIGAGEDQVDGRFSILFGYAYGRAGDLNQSLAWFSRAYRQGSGTKASAARIISGTSFQKPAERGVRSLLAALSERDFEKLGETWGSDAFINNMIGQERLKRSGPSHIAIASTRLRFWDALSDRAEFGAGQEGEKHEYAAIGVLLPLEGQYAPYGLALKNGMEMVFESSHITAVYKDYSGDAAKAAAAARELIYKDKVEVVLGPLLSEAALQVSEVVRESGKSMITFSKSPNLEIGDGIYQLAPTPESQIESLVSAAQEGGLKKTAMIYPDDIGGVEFANLFRDSVRQAGLELAYEASYHKGDFSNFLALASEIESKDIDALFFPDNLQTASRFFSSLSGTFMRPLGTANWDSATELQQAKVVLDGALFVSPFFARSDRQEMQTFFIAYQGRFGSKPDFLAAQGFDAATLVKEALSNAVSERLSFEDALNSLGIYHGLTGAIEIDQNGAIRRRFEVAKLHQGMAVSLSTPDAFDMARSLRGDSDDGVSQDIIQ
ncbi:MAG: hypothetical protein DCC75_06580, partial [Proteobacteria bacterium]